MNRRMRLSALSSIAAADFKPFRAMLDKAFARFRAQASRPLDAEGTIIRPAN